MVDARSDVGALALPRMETVKWGVIGVGARGIGHHALLLGLERSEVVAVADPNESAAQRAREISEAFGCRPPDLYTDGPEGYKRLLERGDVDAVLISTAWETHASIAVDAMRSGKSAFLEVPAAVTLDECRQLVETAEATGRHCMMLENVCYGREELLVLNMCRRGLFGELVHGEAAYFHDLRGQMHEEDIGTGSWRTLHYMARNGNLYPTHGLGPIAQYMNLNRGDRMDYLCSVSSNASIRKDYAAKHFAEGHKWRSGEFVCGDINTTLVRTIEGRTIMIQWDEQLPRPYSRLNGIQGTRGAWAGFPNRIAIEGLSPTTEEWETGGALQKYFDEYEHPLWKRLGERALQVGGHEGMDYIMLARVVECLRSGHPLDQDVYDAASWSAVGPLSELSVANRGSSVDIPDFTGGRWQRMKPLQIVA